MLYTVESLAYGRTFVNPLETSRGVWSLREGLIVRIEAESGVGFGEVAPLPEFGTEDLKAAEMGLKKFISEGKILGLEGLPCCNFGVSAALAQARGMFSTNEKREYSVAGLLPAGTSALEVLKTKLEAGYETFKWKVGVAPIAEEQALFESLIDSLSLGQRLRLDANAGWTEAEFAEWLAFLKPRAKWVEFIEQPLAVGAEARMLKGRDVSGIEIALDESLNGESADTHLAEWPGALVVKAMLMGDCQVLRDRLDLLSDRVVLSSVFETGVGLVNVLSLADALPSLKYALGFDTLAFSDSLSGRCESSRIRMTDRAEINLEQLWTGIRHLN